MSLLELLDPEPWVADAACIEFPEVSFFSERGQSTVEAKAICAACLVRLECLAFAVARPEATEFGVWGGTSPRERRELRAATREAAVPGRSPSGRRVSV